jgi:hypothetical protein
MMILKSFTLNTVLCLSAATLFGCGSSGSDNSSKVTDDNITQESITSSPSETTKIEFENDIIALEENNIETTEANEVSDQIISLPSLDDLTSDYLTSDNDSTEHDSSENDSTNEFITEEEVNLEISWTDNSDNELEFIIERRTIDDVNYGTTYYVAENTTSFEDIQVITGQTYCYRVSASNNYGISPSTEVCITL